MSDSSPFQASSSNTTSNLRKEERKTQQDVDPREVVWNNERDHLLWRLVSKNLNKRDKWLRVYDEFSTVTHSQWPLNVLKERFTNSQKFQQLADKCGYNSDEYITQTMAKLMNVVRSVASGACSGVAVAGVPEQSQSQAGFHNGGSDEEEEEEVQEVVPKKRKFKPHEKGKRKEFRETKSNNGKDEEDKAMQVAIIRSMLQEGKISQDLAVAGFCLSKKNRKVFLKMDVEVKVAFLEYMRKVLADDDDDEI